MTTYGKNIKMTIYGGSHDSEIGVRVTGLPKGFTFDEDELAAFMKRRAPGNDPYSTKRKEADAPVFLSGVDGSTLNGDELCAVIKNTNQRSSDYEQKAFIPRPSHADFAAKMKYGDKVDLRGGGHFSGRLTAPMCIVGGICLQYLKSIGIEIGAHLYSVGGVYDTPFDMVNPMGQLDTLKDRLDFPVLDTERGEAMKAAITDAAEDGDSVGAIIECAATGLPAGLGEHMFDGMENRISAIVFGIPAVKGIEFGNGFACAHVRGSQNNDEFITDGTSVTTKTNNAGGILGGMTSGMPLVFRAAMKPTPSIYKEQNSVDIASMLPVKLSIKGRHDPCVALRATPVFEAAAAIAIYDALLDK
ncbi:MAG: chorismate synthase [Ruminococcaceae bacterium]|nr:chorismate synthase [Oscillospiraceae bacterium]